MTDKLTKFQKKLLDAAEYLCIAVDELTWGLNETPSHHHTMIRFEESKAEFVELLNRAAAKDYEDCEDD